MNDSERELAVFVLGGTIDSRNAPEQDGEAIPLRQSLVRKYLEGLRLDIRITVQVICMKDSRSITPTDREELVKVIEARGCRHNLVTHGTYTMHLTGEVLAAQAALRDKVVGLTGSMGTLLGTVDEEGRLIPSDGQFNLGYSVSELFHLPPGVYQLMNGQHFKLPDEWWSHSPDGISWMKDGKTTHLADNESRPTGV